jgi:hypothetical protein
MGELDFKRYLTDERYRRRIDRQRSRRLYQRLTGTAPKRAPRPRPEWVLDFSISIPNPNKGA